MTLNILNREKINNKAWDNCIINSINSMHYAMSWHLDIVSPEWQGVVYGNYEAVMPIPKKYKYGIPVIIQPFLTQQLGIFSKYKLAPEIIATFLKYLSKPYPVIYNFNRFSYTIGPKGLKINTYPNIELDLNKEVSALKNNYSKNTKRNVRKAKTADVKIKELMPDNNIFNFYFNNLRFKYSEKEKDLFKKIVIESLKRNEGKFFICTNKDDSVITEAFFIIHKNRITFLGSSSSEEGYSKYAAFYIFDSIIEEYANKDYILDFEGSKDEGVARFYKGFGGIMHKYIKLENTTYRIIKRLIISFSSKHHNQ